MKTFKVLYRIFILAAIFLAAFFYFKQITEIRTLNKIIERLSADSRIAEVVVTERSMNRTTIKFLEYDSKGNALEPKFFTFSSDIIQFQSLVIRFDDFYIKKGHPLKGKSAYLFMKAFALNGNKAEVFQINRMDDIPSGYKLEGRSSAFERMLWQRFWKYALDPKEAKHIGVKNVQIEAPGTKFIPGMLYTIKIEHDGGMRIDGVKTNG